MEQWPFDIVIAGGGIAGSLFALRIKDIRPETRILIIEQSASFPKKVGESSSDVTGYYFRRFGLEHLQQQQLKKSGLRFLFDSQGGIEKAQDYSSPSYPSVGNGWQMNRSLLDQTLLDECMKKGCELLRPAHVMSYHHSPFATEVEVEISGERTRIKTKWFIDATGRRNLVANKEGWKIEEKEPFTASSWAHFKGMRNISTTDGKQELWEKVAIGPREDATIHFMGKGYWIWHITLSDDTTSVGIVYDKRLLSSEGEHPKAFFERFVHQQPLLGPLLKEASFEGFKHYPHLPYRSSCHLIPGLATVGDASFFIDPLFSPGIEMTCQQVLGLADLVSDNLKTGHWSKFKAKLYELNMQGGYVSRIEQYKKKYYLMGDYEAYSLITQIEFAFFFSIYLFPAVLFPSLLKWYLRSNFIGLAIYRWYVGHLVKAAAFRETLSHDQRQWFPRQTFTGVRVPPAHLMPWISFGLFNRAITRFIVFEFQLLRWRFKH